MLAGLSVIGAPGFEPGTSPTRITRLDDYPSRNSLHFGTFKFEAIPQITADPARLVRVWAPDRAGAQ
jgi:hypothetical protein